jgi:hypothetical protein
MPYTRFRRTKAGVAVYKKKPGGGERKAFTARTKSIKAAKRTARLRHAR